MEYDFSFKGPPVVTAMLVVLCFVLAAAAFYAIAVADNMPLFISCILLIVGGIFFCIGLSQWKLKRIIENTPTSTVRSLAMGLVEITGTVAKPFTTWLTSPFTRNPCTFYYAEIQELRRQGKRSEWVTLFKKNEWVAFYAKDKTGSVLVDPAGATIDSTAVYQTQTGLFSGVPIPIVEFCTKNNIGIRSWLGMSKTLKFTEKILPAKSKIYVLGTAKDNPHVEDGTAQQNSDDIMIQQDKRNPYYISDKSEKEVLTSFAWKVTACLAGGGTGIVAGIVLAVIGFGMG